jgi:CheY-like chemotaxis protein
MVEHVIKRKESGEYELGVVSEEESEVIQRADKAFGKSVSESTSSKKNLLLVDDSGFALRTIRGFIGNKYDVRMVTSGLDAISAIHQKKPDLILLDYQMPMFDGKQTMEKIKEVEGAQDIPIVFVTSVNSKEHIKSVLDLKPAGYLLKPVDGDRLMQTIENIIGK